MGIHDHSKTKTETHQWGCYAAHLPGQATTLFYANRADAVACARDTNKQPWNRAANAAMVIAPNGKGFRSY